ncbi:MAG: asparaginyl/glutamyl-tRNA amidotransferase subunit C [Beggiatoa sp. IS2]|nr:MAG: asparaginyl/glutamyl-tRNA amidotransferase subunit C [Beggiatoa sp. IS2]
MSLKREEVEKIAHLARISLQEQDIASYTVHLSNILALVEQMNSVETAHIIPMAHPLDATARLRPDVVSEINQRDAFQAIAPQVEAGLYLVPKVIE